MKNGFCISGLRRAALLAMMAFALVFAAACGGEGGSGKCKDNEVWAEDSDRESKCLLKCEPGDEAGVCPDGMACAARSGDLNLCTTRTGGGTDPGDGTDPGGTDPSEGLSQEDKQLCEDYCYLVYGCVTETCSQINPDAVDDIVVLCLMGDSTGPGCYDEMKGQQAAEMREEAERIVYGNEDGTIGTTKNGCETTKSIRCGELGLFDNCNCKAPTNVGDACESDSDCDAGDFRLGLCMDKDDAGNTVFPDGMCTAGVCSRFLDEETNAANPNGPTLYADVSLGADCGTKSACVNTGVGMRENCVPSAQDDCVIRVGLCESLCDNNEECREGYACQVAGLAYEQNRNRTTPADPIAVPAGLARTCNLKCTADTDCVESGRCNTDTGACEFSCDGTGGPEACAALGGECEEIGEKNICVLP